MRIITLRALGLGDLLTAVPALRALRTAFPRARITLMTPVALHQLAHATGAVDDLIDASGLGAPPPPRADLAVNLHGRGPQSTQVLQRSEPGELWAFATPPHADGAPPWWPGEHEVRRWCRLVAHHGLDVDPDDLRVRVTPPGSRGRAVVIHPGAASGARRWPAERFGAVAGWLATRHEVVITGSADEAPLARQVAERAGLPADRVLAGRTSPMELARVVADARLVVCGDTGVGHLAVATGTPSVALFGPTSPGEWGPPPSPIHRVLWCGRTGDPHADHPDPGLLDITVEQVREAVGDCLGAARGRSGS